MLHSLSVNMSYNVLVDPSFMQQCFNDNAVVTQRNDYNMFDSMAVSSISTDLQVVDSV